MDEEQSARGPQDRLRFRHRNCTVVVANYGTPDDLLATLADEFWDLHKLVLPAPQLLRFHLEDGAVLSKFGMKEAKGVVTITTCTAEREQEWGERKQRRSKRVGEVLIEAAASGNNPRVLSRKYRRIVKNVVRSLEESSKGLKKWRDSTEGEKQLLMHLFQEFCASMSYPVPEKNCIRSNLASAIRNRILYLQKKN